MAARFSPINLGAPGEEISKKDLFAVIQRFKHFNQSRLQRVREFLHPRQQDFLHLLPLLFHINHPLLPGFVSLDTPAGIPDYTPSKPTLDKAAAFSKSFIFKRKALKSYPIHSLFLMGSVGSMAFSRDSDVDIWLCHQPGLASDELSALRQKADLIEKWAATLKLEVHFFLVNSQQFRCGENTPISEESSGETQHYLLLEEFYRTSIYIAGRVPMWWLVPPTQEAHYQNYVAHLLENRFIADVDVIDFGGLQDMPVNEFVSATLWHIYKSLTSPHKAILKLFLMESYASEFPAPNWLCASMKAAIYRGECTVDALDPYLMIYSKVDDYLRMSNAPQRLELARESFHAKIMGTSIYALDNQARILHENFLVMIASRWNWPENLLPELSTQKFWDIQRAVSEHKVIREQLQECLRMILKIIGTPIDQQLQENTDLKLLNRKLRAHLDLKPNKVELLTTRSMVQVKPDTLSLVRSSKAKPGYWYLFTGKLPAEPINPETAIKSSNDLLELLSWLVINGLYSSRVNVQLATDNRQQNADDLKLLLRVLAGFLSSHLSNQDTGLESYALPNRLIASLILINWCEDKPLTDAPEQIIISERSDPLSYGEKRQCLIQKIQRLSISSWGEVTLQTYAGLDGILTALTDVFNQSTPPLQNKNLSIVCLNRGRGRSISMRVESIYQRLLTLFGDPSKPSQHRYILPTESGFCCFKHQNGILSFSPLENTQLLLQELSSPQPSFSPVILDDFVLEQSFIPFLYQHNLADTIQIFFHVTSKHVAVYIIDEKGSLFTRQHQGANPTQILIHYTVFLRTLSLESKIPEHLAIKCYEIQRNSAGLVSCHPTQVKAGSSALDLRVRIVDDQADGQVVYCNEKRFELHDLQSYRQLKKHIVSFRRRHEDYPFHVTEIDVPLRLLGIAYDDQAQSLHYLNYKQKIEEKLNI